MVTEIIVLRSFYDVYNIGRYDNDGDNGDGQQRETKSNHNKKKVVCDVIGVGSSDIIIITTVLRLNGHYVFAQY